MMMMMMIKGIRSLLSTQNEGIHKREAETSIQGSHIMIKHPSSKTKSKQEHSQDTSNKSGSKLENGSQGLI